MKTYPHIDFGVDQNPLTGFQLIKLQPGWADDRQILKIPHRHSFHEIIWIISGLESHIVDFKEYSVSNKELLVIPKGSVHDFTLSTNSVGWKILFADSFFERHNLIRFHDYPLFIPYIGVKKISLNHEQNLIIDNLVDLLRKVLSHLHKQTILMNLIILLSDYSYRENQKIDHRFIDFIQLLNKNVHVRHNVQFYCRELNIPQRALNILVKSHTGLTTLAYIQDRLINEAKSLLCDKNHSISEIGYQLGFDDALYFSRFFKGKVGMSPDTYRNHLA